MSTRRMCLMLIVAAILHAPAVHGQDDAPEREPAAALSHAIQLLIAEGKAAKEDERLPRASADFAAEYPDPVHPEMLGKRLLRPIDRDPFVDAYVRWQLTGFDATLPEMTDREFERFAEDLPAMVANPRADERLINDLQRIVQIGELTERQQEEVNGRFDRMAARTGKAGDLNLPAVRFREWAQQQLEGSARRALVLKMEHVAAMVRAGWRVEELKQGVFEACERYALDENLTLDDRRDLEQMANRLAGTSRLYITSAGIRANALAVSFDETGIYDFDANRWMRALRRD